MWNQLGPCELPGCETAQDWNGLCRTHRRAAEIHGNPEVQHFLAERDRQREIERGKSLDWEYLSDDQMVAIERGVRDAFYENRDLNEYDLDNLHQEMIIWAAGHKADVQRIRSPRLLRQQIKRRAIRLHRGQWERDREIESLDRLAESMEED